MNKILITLIFIIGGLIHSHAQSSISGSIQNSDQETLPGAFVFLENTDFNTSSLQDGSFTINNVPAGTYKLIVSYLGYSDYVQVITVDEGNNPIIIISLQDDAILQEVVINGRLEGQMKALSSQRNKANITNIVAAEQIERFPDANLGDALKRISGVNVQYDQGEARFGNIRGTAPALNSFTINGERIPSAEAEERSNQLDLIPADMVETIELNKALTPDMDADAIGGSINLVTKKASGKEIIKGTIGSGYNALPQAPLYKGKLSYSNRFVNNKIGLILNASYLDRSTRSDNVEAEWEYLDEDDKNGTAYTSDFQIRQYELKRIRQSYGGVIDFRLNKRNNIYFDANYTRRNDFENRYRLRFKDIEQDDDGNWIAEVRRQTKGGASNINNRRLEDQRTQVFGFGGKHKLAKMKIDWRISSLAASERRPNERYVSYRNKDIPVTLNLDNQSLPQINIDSELPQDLNEEFSLKELTEENQLTEERDLNGRIDFKIPVLSGKLKSNFKTGLRYKSKSKNRSNNFFEFEPTDEDGFSADALSNIKNKNFDNFQVGNHSAGSFVDESFLGQINFEEGFEKEEILEELAGNFDATENVSAAYAMYTQNIGEKIMLLGGVRYEGTAVNYQGKIFDGETLEDSDRQTDSYFNVLPSLHLKYSPSKYTNVRFAWTNTLARPNYFDLVPYQEINTEDNEIKIGNPSLEATTSMNFDLLVEKYFKNLGIVSGGVYFKNINNVISDLVQNDYEYNGNLYDEFKQPENIGNAVLYGCELGLERRLDFLPGFLGNTSIYTNYTYNLSELTNISLEDRADEKLPLAGTPTHLINASIAYDAKLFDIRLSYNYADRFIEEYGDESFYDRWYDEVHYLDLNINGDINKSWSYYASVNNMLNQPLSYSQGINDRLMQIEYYGLQFRAGVKFKFKSK